MAKVLARLPIAARGVSLLALVAASGYLFVTKDEGQEAIAAGHVAFAAEPVAPVNDPELATIVLTDAGNAVLAATPQAAAEKVSKILFDLDDDVPLPEGTTGHARESKYPIRTMNVNQSFHIPKTAEMENPVAAIASSLTSARAEFAVPTMQADGVTPEMETVIVKTYQTGEDGKKVKNEDGKWIVVSEAPVIRPKMTIVRDWTVKAVNDSDPRGAGARVWRTK